MHKLIYLLILFILTSCSNDDFKKYFELKGLRVIALIASSPEINSSQSVNITPYISYPEADDTTLTINYKACLDPGIAFGASVSCDDVEPELFITEDSFTYNTINLGASNFYTGSITPIPISIPASFFTVLDLLPSNRKFNGVDVLVFVEIIDNNNPQERVKSLKRISLTTKNTGLNTNPNFTGIMQNNNPITTFPNHRSRLRLNSPSPPQSYQLINDGSIRNYNENMLVSWFTSSGEFQFSRSDALESVRFNSKGKTCGVIVAAYRDGRGGVAVRKIQTPCP